MDDSRDPAVLAENLRDLRRVDRWLGGQTLTLAALHALALPSPDRLSVVDVASGGGELPAALVRSGAAARAVALDRNEAILELARRSAPGVVLVHGDALELPFPDGAFDVATCSLALHHFDPPGAVTVLREMRRVARVGVVVNDLVRCWHGYVGALVLTPLFSRSPVTRHDAPLSIRRAYTVAELRDLLAHAGLVPVALRRLLGFRVALAARSAE